MKRGRAGFSLIEVLVALSIAAVSLLAILDLQRQLVDGQRRYERALAVTELRRTALLFIRNINPRAQPEGLIHLPPNVDIQWTAQPLGDARRNIGLPNGDGNFMVQLYRLQVRVSDRRTGQSQMFAVEQVGWKALQLRPSLSF